MSTAHTVKKPISLLTHFRRYLVIVVGLLLILLLVRFLSENLLLSTWQSDATNALMLQQEVGTLQQSMLDQETGLRGYISTDDPLFLQPFTQGRQLYRMSLQHLKDHLSSLHFQDVPTKCATRCTTSETVEKYAFLMRKNEKIPDKGGICEQYDGFDGNHPDLFALSSLDPLVVWRGGAHHRVSAQAGRLDQTQ